MAPASQKFNYNHYLFHFRTIYISVFFASIFVMLAMMTIDMSVYFIIFAILFILSIILFGISPLMTSHELGPSGIVLRQGILFKIELGWDEIRSVERQEDKKLGIGLTATLGKPVIPLTTQKQNLILIKLNQPIRFSSVLWKKTEEILIDVNDPDIFVKRAVEHLDLKNVE